MLCDKCWCVSTLTWNLHVYKPGTDIKFWQIHSLERKNKGKWSVSVIMKVSVTSRKGGTLLVNLQQMSGQTKWQQTLGSSDFIKLSWKISTWLIYVSSQTNIITHTEISRKSWHWLWRLSCNTDSFKISWNWLEYRMSRYDAP